MEKKNQEKEERITDRDIRLLLEGKSAQALTKFLSKGMKENKMFRRKVLAWLIDTDTDQLSTDAVLGELTDWINEILEPWAGMKPRMPDLRELSTVKAAVKNHPDLAVPIYLTIVGGIGDFLDTFGGGPESFYNSFVRNFDQAASHLPAIGDPELQKRYFSHMEHLAGRGDNFGYGVGYDTEDIMSKLRPKIYPILA